MPVRDHGTVFRQERERFDLLLRRAAIVLPIGSATAAVVIYAFTRSGPGLRFLLLYVTPIMFAIPVWARLRLRSFDELAKPIRAVDAIVVGLAFSRLVLGDVVPYSGHMLFLTYSGTTTPFVRYRLLAFSLWLESSIFKLFVWRDPVSWFMGLTIGLFAACATHIIEVRRAKVE